MNFQFTNKIKKAIFTIIGIGVILFVLGFLFGEKSHLYITPHNEESIEILHKYETKGFKMLTQSEKKHYIENKGGAPLEEAESLLVEYYHELPYTVEELKSKINTAAKEQGISVIYQDMSHHEKEHAYSHEETVEDHESHSHVEAAEEEVIEEDEEEIDHDGAHSDEEEDHHGNAEHAEEAHHEEHALVLLMTPQSTDHHGHHEGNAEHAEENDHGHHGPTHSPIQILEHIVHEEGSFNDTHHSRSWSNLLINAFFFFGIGLGALFFIALQYATESGWGVVTKRILEAITSYVKVGWVFLVIVFLGATFGLNHIYHWMDPEVTDPNSSHFDPIIAGKKPFLSQVFFWGANAVYFGVFIFFAWWFRKRSLREDKEGGTKIHMGNYAKGAIFLVLFGYLSSVMSWHWIMSIDTHWFSTLFGWYVFSGIWISAIITILLLIFFLKGRGYLEFVNESHIHDLGKWLFAVSILWSYLFFSQFMLIWYADIPEETTYYIARFTDYKFILWGVFAVNLILPLVFLMSREAKRSRNIIIIVGTILLVTHWLDVFIMVMPGTVFDHWKIGFLEIGMFLIFLGIFAFVVLRSLTKAPLLVKNHPYLEENLHQHT